MTKGEDEFAYVGKLSNEIVIKVLQQMNKKLDQQAFDDEQILNLFVTCMQASVAGGGR
jgi:hypothetical protein